MSYVGPALQTHGVEAESLPSLAEIAIKELRAQGPSGIVCGPITTGGTGNQTYNFQVFNACILGLKRRGEKIFSQVPYEYGLRKLAHTWEAAGNTGYYWPIIDEFYVPLFQTGLITKGFFIPGYRSSNGARREEDELYFLGSTLIYLTREEIIGFLAQEYPPEHVEKIAQLLAT